MQTTAPSEEEFSKDPLSSNVVLINNTPIEDLLQGEVGQSQCCSACGDSDCRTVTVSGKTYETIPVGVIVRAGLAAARRARARHDRCCSRRRAFMRPLFRAALNFLSQELLNIS